MEHARPFCRLQGHGERRVRPSFQQEGLPSECIVGNWLGGNPAQEGVFRGPEVLGHGSQKFDHRSGIVVTAHPEVRSGGRWRHRGHRQRDAAYPSPFRDVEEQHVTPTGFMAAGDAHPEKLPVRHQSGHWTGKPTGGQGPWPGFATQQGLETANLTGVWSGLSGNNPLTSRCRPIRSGLIF